MIEADLVIDTREPVETAWQFNGCISKHVGFRLERRALAAGDYAAQLPGDDSPEATAVVERKTYGDLLSTLTHGRDRFERELERLTEYAFRALVIEATLEDIARGVGHSRAHPRAIIASLVAFSQRFGVHVVFAGDRRHAEAYCWRLLERWVRDRAEARKAVPA